MKGEKVMGKDNLLKFEQLNMYGVGTNYFVSAIKIKGTTFIVSSYFEKSKSFYDSVDSVIEKQVNSL
ncbi:MAG: hypothetical protein AB1Z23_06600 [Eubacteriales bacterium]